jgi:hypothetical protein
MAFWPAARGWQQIEPFFFHFPVATMDNILKFLGVNSEKMMIWKKPELLYY